MLDALDARFKSLNQPRNYGYKIMKGTHLGTIIDFFYAFDGSINFSILFKAK